MSRASRPRISLSRSPRTRIPVELPMVSLLWPDGIAPRMVGEADWANDLGLNDLVNALALNGRYNSFIRQLLIALTADPHVIQWRQAVLADCLNNPSLVDATAALLPRLSALQQGNTLLGKRQRNLLLDTADHLVALEAYVQVTQDLHAALSAADLTAAACLQLRDNLATLIGTEQYQALRDELPELRAPLQDIRSLTIGLNLDVELRPESAALISVNNFSFGDSASWLERVIGVRQNPQDERGIAPLHRLPEDLQARPLSPFFQDLDRLLEQIAAPVAKALTRYARTASGTLAHLEFEFAFFVGATRLLNRLRTRGIQVCTPQVLPREVRQFNAQELMNAALALTDGAVVANDAQLGETGRIAILTGPNSGGKTTYLRSIGLAQVMFQAGLLLPAAAAAISPVQNILTHFPALESRQTGRLAEEAVRLRGLFQQANEYTLVLLNETFSSTSSGEAVYLAQDMLAALRAIGTRGVYATHLIELAERIPEIEALTSGSSALFSLVAGVTVSETGEGSPTYRISPGLPHGRNYARDIARKHGISLEQILAARPSG